MDDREVRELVAVAAFIQQARAALSVLLESDDVLTKSQLLLVSRATERLWKADERLRKATG